MFNYEPPGYRCPFCRLLAGERTPQDDPDEIVWQTELVTAKVASRWWPNAPGHVFVFPNTHYENIYDLPSRYGHAVHDMIRDIACAMRRGYGCQGISTRQHNEPAAGQDVWHYHVHVLPHDDAIHEGTRLQPEEATPAQRRHYVDLLRGAGHDRA